jgi:hypothetical protein
MVPDGYCHYGHQNKKTMNRLPLFENWIRDDEGDIQGASSSFSQSTNQLKDYRREHPQHPGRDTVIEEKLRSIIATNLQRLWDIFPRVSKVLDRRDQTLVDKYEDKIMAAITDPDHAIFVFMFDHAEFESIIYFNPHIKRYILVDVSRHGVLDESKL